MTTLMQGSTKRRFIEVTYEMIKERGVENLRVRDIAKEVGCSAQALYKHFESMDYLIAMASVKFLESYVEELMELIDQDVDPLATELMGWEALTKHAFAAPRVYLHLFWNIDPEVFKEVSESYYQIFPPRNTLSDVYAKYFPVTAYTNNLPDRERAWLSEAAEQGMISHDAVDYVSTVFDCILHSMLIKHADDCRQQPEAAKRAADECYALVRRTLEQVTT